MTSDILSMIPENNQRRWPTIGINILIISAIVIMTPIVTFLYIRFGQGMINVPLSVDVIRDTIIDNEPTTNKYNNISRKITVTTVYNDTQVMTDDSSSHGRNNVWIVGLPLNSTGKPKINNHSAVEELNATSRSFMADSVQVDRLIVGGPLLSRRNKQPIVVVQENRYPNHKSDIYMSVDDDVNNNSQLLNNNEMHQHNIMNKSNHIDHYRYSTIDEDIPKAEGDSSNSYYNNMYDLSYNVDSYGYKDSVVPSKETKWTVNNPTATGQMHLEDSPSLDDVGESGYGRVPYDYKPRYPVGHRFYNRLPNKNYQPSNVPDDEYDKPNLHNFIKNKFNSETISTLALIVLGLAKLKTIGFLQFMLLLMFKFKLLMIALFVKLLLLFKFIKIFKIQILPLLFLSLLPTLTSMLQRMSNMQLITPQNTSANTLLSNILDTDGTLSGGGGGSSGGGSFITRPIQVPGTLGSRDSSSLDRSFDNTFLSLFNSNNIDLRETKTVPPYENQSSYDPLNKIDDLYFFSRSNSELSVFLDPFLAISQIILDSEMCVERVACRMAAAGKIGIKPVWINWVINSIPKFVPDEKLEAYYKAYNVSNKIFTSSSTPDSWATWCLKHYECNITNVTSVTN